jgi:hypothetical protein
VKTISSSRALKSAAIWQRAVFIARSAAIPISCMEEGFPYISSMILPARLVTAEYGLVVALLSRYI